MNTNYVAHPPCPCCDRHFVVTVLLWTNEFHYRCTTCGYNWTGAGLGANAA
jgi:transposase-like protein